MCELETGARAAHRSLVHSFVIQPIDIHNAIGVAGPESKTPSLVKTQIAVTAGRHEASLLSDPAVPIKCHHNALAFSSGVGDIE